MWTRLPGAALRGTRPLRQTGVHRTVLYSRKYNGNAQGPPKTYFQPIEQPPAGPPKPKRRILRGFLLGTTTFLFGFYAHAYLEARAELLGLADELGDALEVGQDGLPVLEQALQAGAAEAQAKTVHPLTTEQATEILQSRAGFSVTPTAVSHTCQSVSNLPCEDTWSSGTFTFFNDAKKDWSEWAIFDGHAGPRTSQVLKELLPAVVGDKLWEDGCMMRPYSPNDIHIVRSLQGAFKYLDESIFGEATKKLIDGDMSRAETISLISNMLSGSCALMAVFDPAKGVLRVANTGDSRAVLGRWEGGKYVAKALSADHTGFNEDEVARLQRAHPGEDVIDPQTGRIFGLAVTRAFGDSRWKWTQELSRKAHELYWGPAPRSDPMIKTPPYLTAEPEVKEAKIQTGAHPDFLIMGSDGLWDNMSNDDAVTCVQMWLEKNKPTAFIQKFEEEQQAAEKRFSFASLGKKKEQQQAEPIAGGSPVPQPGGRRSINPLSPFTPGPAGPPLNPFANPFSDDTDSDEDTYWDESECTLKWRVSPRHFVVEDEHCGVHLIKNAFGGKRRRLFEGIMTIQPPLSRNVRDDVTVHVVFFGVDAEEAAKGLMEGQTSGQRR